MKNILIAMKVDDNHKEQLCAAADGEKVVFELHPSDEQIAEAEVIVGNILPARLERAEKLKFVQLHSAGVGAYRELCAPGRDKNLLLCTANGSYGLAIAEHMFGMLLGLQKRLFNYRDQQYGGKWEDLGCVRSVSESNVLVVGMGDIGGSFAQRCKAFGAKVSGIRRSQGECPEYCDRAGGKEMLDAWLPEMDIVFLCMPETDETMSLFNRERLFSMKKGAILLNAGRGSAVDTDALVDALNAEVLAGVGLDVTNPEPLPADHPLWACPNACITPHVSGGMHLQQTHDNIVRLACANIRAYLNGGKLKNLFDYERGY